MRTISDDLQTHLDSGVTTLCWCWRVTRRDGAVLGFTDHDRQLSFDGTAFEAASGFTATEIRGLAHYLQQENGRLYQYRCDADLGDGRCGVSLSAPGFTANGMVSSVVS
ncbi:MAG: DUF2163 domain-containing protein, partial [Hyphomicrobiaceae bacterium]